MKFLSYGAIIQTGIHGLPLGLFLWTGGIYVFSSQNHNHETRIVSFTVHVTVCRLSSPPQKRVSIEMLDQLPTLFILPPTPLQPLKALLALL